MRLEYRILWFEDQPDNVAAHQGNITSAIARLGFAPAVEWRVVIAGSGDPLANLPPQQDVDLVMMDWRLGGGFDGAELARRVRQAYRNTDIIFYSSESAKVLREQIFKQDIDGVHCFHRTNLTDRTIGLVKAQVRKVLDLNHMRGLVMAATSDLDHAMIQCLEMVQQVAYPAKAAEFAAQIGAQVVDGLRSKANEIEKIISKGRLDKLLKEPAFGAALRLAVLQNEMTKLAEQISEVHLIESLERYQAEVIGPRNDFAHRKAIVDGGQLRLEGRQDAFDQQSMIALRLKLLDHSDNLRALLTLLKEMATAAGEQDLVAKIEGVEDAVGQASTAASLGDDADVVMIGNSGES